MAALVITQLKQSKFVQQPKYNASIALVKVKPLRIMGEGEARAHKTHTFSDPCFNYRGNTVNCEQFLLTQRVRHWEQIDQVDSLFCRKFSLQSAEEGLRQIFKKWLESGAKEWMVVYLAFPA